MTEQTNSVSPRSFLFHCGRVISGTSDSEDRRITIHADRITGIDIEDQAGEIVIDLRDAIITPGFVDVHVHGGGGFNLHTQDADEIRAYAQWAPSSGTTSFLIGTVGIPGALPEAELRAAADAVEQPGPGAEALGVHLEGPYINVLRRGAHDPSWLRIPNDPETTRLLAMTRGHLRLITIAPELPGAIEMIRRLVAEGVTVSIGHTDATYEQARDAIKQGITHATHCFNAMRPLLHREPGALGAIIEAATVRGEIIADGVHVHPAAMRVLAGALGPERTVVVTDALPGAGLPDAVFSFGGQAARVIDGVARLADGTITGSVLTTAQGLRNMVRLAGVPLVDAVRMLTINPAHSARVETRKGRIEAGYDADLLIFDQDLGLHATICRGRLAYVSDAWRERLAPMGTS